MAEKATQSRGQSRGWTVGVALVVLAAVIFYFVHGSGHDAVEIHTAAASHADIEGKVSANGKVEPVVDFQAHSPGPTVVSRVYVELGENVVRGEELIRLDDSDARKNIASAQAALQSAEAALANLKNNGTHEENLGASSDLAAAKSQQQQAMATLSATQALQARGSASANEVASAQQRVADANARLAQLQARGTGRYSATDLAAQQAQVMQAKVSLAAAQMAYTGVDIRAPFAGTIYSLPVSDLDFVQAGEALLNLTDLKQIQVRAYFDEPEIGKLAPGQPVRIVWDPKPNSAWHGHIKQTPTTIISTGTRNVGECLITVDDAKGDLLPNANVTVTVTTSQKFGVLSIPREALHTEPTRNYVFRVVDGKLQRTPVQVGTGINLTRVEIASGLKDGDIVALSSLSSVELKDKMEVKVVP